MPEKEKCVICSEAITNPVCPDCLQREVEHWLVDLNPSLIKDLRDYTGIFNSYRHDGVKCILCGKEMAVCAHCFCKDIHEMFSDKLGRDAEEFLFSFNFELKTGAG